MQNYNSTYFDIAFYAERSIEDEIDRAGQADIPLFIGAYVTIFLYLSLALGSYTSLKYFIFEVRITLGLIGLFIVASSAFAALGLFGYLHLKSNLIVAEVVPFLLLAIGADNIFIFVLQYKRLERELNGKNLPMLKIEEMIGEVLHSSALSMVMCSVAEALLLYFGALMINMPAVVTYSVSAGTAVLFNFLLQMTAFPAVLCLDQKRLDSRRADLLCCLQSDTSKEELKKQNEELFSKPLPIDEFFEKKWFPMINHKYVRPTVILSFIILTCASIAVCFNFTRVGLDQDLSVPEESYVRDFFEFQEAYLLVGVPVYFVIAGNLSYEKQQVQEPICSRAGCAPGSFAEMITLASDEPEYWRIETAPQSWLDDFIDWADPGTLTTPPVCCRCKRGCQDFDKHFKPCMANKDDDLVGYYTKKSYPNSINSMNSYSYLSDHDNYEINEENYLTEDVRGCHRCILPRQERNFYRYLDWFLQDNPGTVCAKGGHAAYAHSVHFVNKEKTMIDATSFMTYFLGLEI